MRKAAFSFFLLFAALCQAAHVHFPGYPLCPSRTLYDFRYWHLREIRSYEAQMLSCGRGVTVAVVDSGVNTDHPLFSGRLELSLAYDFGDNDTDVTDLLGHGTAVSGIIAQIAPCAKILPLKINHGGEDYFDAEPLVRALQYLLDILPEHPEIKIVNLSLAIDGYEMHIADLLYRLAQRGVVIVAAAGNEGEDHIYFPASLPYVLAVSATNIYGALLASSNHGNGTFLAAPGSDIYVPSLVDGGYIYMSGTSMSTAVVSGIAALLLEKEQNHPWLWLARGSLDTGDPGYDPYYGFGTASALNTLISALSRNLPVLPTYLELAPGQERTIYFLPDPSLQVANTNSTAVEILSFRPEEGTLTVRGKAPGHAEIYLYTPDASKAAGINLEVTPTPSNILEALVYPPEDSQKRLFCTYGDIKQTIPEVWMFLTHQEGSAYTTILYWSYPYPVESGIYLGCQQTENFAYPGINELLLCAPGSHCTRHIFWQ